MIDTSLNFGNPIIRSQKSWIAWYAFAFGAGMALFFVYVGITRPTAEELSLLRQQLQSLEKSVAMVAGQRDAVDETNDLLALLSQQQSQANAARKTLVDLRELNSNLLKESSRVEDALAAVKQLASIKDLVLANADLTDRAMDAFSATEQLQERLADSATSNELALQASLDLLAIRGELLKDVESTDAAKDAMHLLVDIRATLGNEGTKIDVAQDRVTDLIALKNSVLNQTNDLSDSIETLEITEQLNERFRRATSSFKDIRDWMAEVIALEPTLAQVRQVMEPFADMVNLKRMDPKQLRDFAKVFIQQPQDRPAIKPSNIVSHRYPSDSQSISTETP